MSDKGLLAVIAVILLGVVTYFVVEATTKNSPAKHGSDNVGEISADIGSKINNQEVSI